MEDWLIGGGVLLVIIIILVIYYMKKKKGGSGGQITTEGDPYDKSAGQVQSEYAQQLPENSGAAATTPAPEQ